MKQEKGGEKRNGDGVQGGEKEAMWRYGAQGREMERRSINKVVGKIKKAMHWKMRTWKSMQFSKTRS